MKKLILAAFSILSVCYAGSAQAQNVVNIGPCQVYDTDGGAAPSIAGYVAGICDNTNVISYTKYNYNTIDADANPILDTYEPTYSQYIVNDFISGNPNTMYMGMGGYGWTYAVALGSDGMWGTYGDWFQTNDMPGKGFFMGLDRRRNPLGNYPYTDTGIIEIIHGTKTGYFPLLTIQVRAAPGKPAENYVLLSMKPINCQMNVINGPLPQVTGNLYGHAIGTMLAGTGGAWGLGLLGSGTPGGTPAHGVSSCKKDVVLPPVKK